MDVQAVQDVAKQYIAALYSSRELRDQHRALKTEADLLALIQATVPPAAALTLADLPVLRAYALRPDDEQTAARDAELRSGMEGTEAHCYSSGPGPGGKKPKQ